MISFLTKSLKNPIQSNRKQKYYVYVVSFFHDNGNGCVQLYRKKKINNLEEFNSVRDYIAQINGFNTVAIVNWKLLCRERVALE